MNPGTWMDLHIMKITTFGVYSIQNCAILQTEPGGNTEEIEVNTDREEGWEQGEKEGRGKVGEGEGDI